MYIIGNTINTTIHRIGSYSSENNITYNKYKKLKTILKRSVLCSWNLFIVHISYYQNTRVT